MKENKWVQFGREHKYVAPDGEILATILHNPFKGVYWVLRGGKGYVTLEQAKAAVEKMQ